MNHKLYENGIACCDNASAPAPFEPMFDVIQETSSMANRAKELSQRIMSQLYGLDSVEDGGKKEPCCAYNTLIDIRATLRETMRILEDICVRMEG